jgi:poly(A) polymerase
LSELPAEVARALAAQLPDGYFVGGCVRDCLLDLPIKDVDLAVAGSPWPAAQRLARALGGSPFWLHEEEGIARVSLRPLGLDLDLARLRGSIEEDLLARDLTINAMAIRVPDGLRPGSPLIDPAGGQADLAGRRIRFARPDAIERDPLRSLRALRFRWQLGFGWGEGAPERIRHDAPLLSRVSRERVRDELFQMLQRPSAAAAIEDLIDTRLWPMIFPGNDVLPEWDGLLAPCTALRRLEVVLAAAGAEAASLAEHLAEQPTPPRSRLALLRWSGLFLPGSAFLGAQARRLRSQEVRSQELKLSVREVRLVTRALEAAPAAVELAGRWPVAGRERLRFFQAAGEAGPEAALLAAAVTGWGPPAAEMLAEALRRKAAPEGPLLSGQEVMRLLDLSPGPRVGQLLAALAEARADGLVATPEEARAWLRQFVEGRNT